MALYLKYSDVERCRVPIYAFVYDCCPQSYERSGPNTVEELTEKEEPLEGPEVGDTSLGTGLQLRVTSLNSLQHDIRYEQDVNNFFYICIWLNLKIKSI